MDKKPKSCSHGHSKTLLLNCWSRLWIIVGHKTIKFLKAVWVCMRDGSSCGFQVFSKRQLLPHPRPAKKILRYSLAQRSFDLLQQGFLITKLHNIITFLYQSFLLDSGANQFRQNLFESWCVNDHWQYLNLNPSQAPLESYKDPKLDLKGKKIFLHL